MTPRTPASRDSRTAHNTSHAHDSAQVKAMAVDMIELRDGIGAAATVDGLKAKGWSEDDIRRHGDAARVRAQAISPRALA